MPIVFCETRPLAQEWVYRFLGAAVAEHERTAGAEALALHLPPARPLARPEATTAEIRAWARREGLAVTDRGRLRPEIVTAWHEAHHQRP